MTLFHSNEFSLYAPVNVKMPSKKLLIGVWGCLTSLQRNGILYPVHINIFKIVQRFKRARERTTEIIHEL